MRERCEVQPSPQQLLPRVSHDPAERRVHVLVAALHIGYDHAHRRVVENFPEALLVHAPFLLGAFPLRDIHHHADDAFRPPVPHGNRLCPIEHVAPASICAPKPVLHADRVLPAVRHFHDRRQHTVPILIMDPGRPPGKKILAFSRLPENAGVNVVDHHAAGFDVPVPDALAGRLGGEVQPVFALTQRLFGMLEHSDVDARPHPFADLALVVKDGYGPGEVVMIRSVRMNAPVLDLEKAPARHGPLPGFPCSGPGPPDE